MDGRPRLERSDSGGGPRPPDLKVLKSRSGVRRNASSNNQGWDALRALTGGRASREASKAAEAASQRASRGDIEQDRTGKRPIEQGAGPGPRAQGEGRVDRASERRKRAGRASEGGEKRREPRGPFCKTYFIPSQWIETKYKCHE